MNFFSFILVYVDDMLIASKDENEVELIIDELQSQYKLRRSPDVDLFLGVRLKWEQNGKSAIRYLRLSQEVYVCSILRRFGMEKCKPAITPMVEGFFSGLKLEEDLPPVDISLYQQMVGSLLYLGLKTRPDILASVLILARFQQKPTNYCHRAAKRVLRYLKGTSMHNLTYKSGNIDLNVYLDSDFAGYTMDKKSMTGYKVKLGDSVVNWVARKQATVTLSTCEAEYFAM